LTKYIFHFNITLNTTGCPLLKKKKDHRSPRYVAFYTPLSALPCKNQGLSFSAPLSQTSLADVEPLKNEAKFHTHTKQQAKL